MMVMMISEDKPTILRRERVGRQEKHSNPLLNWLRWDEHDDHCDYPLITLRWTWWLLNWLHWDERDDHGDYQLITLGWTWWLPNWLHWDENADEDDNCNRRRRLGGFTKDQGCWWLNILETFDRARLCWSCWTTLNSWFLRSFWRTVDLKPSFSGNVSIHPFKKIQHQKCCQVCKFSVLAQRWFLSRKSTQNYYL